MRNIHFKGLTVDENKWVHGDLIQDDFHKTAYISDEAEKWTEEVHYDSVSIFTGLTDANGDNVYEGDIIELEDEDGMIISQHEVVWGGEEYPAFHLKPSLDSDINDFSSIYHEKPYENFIVVGHKYKANE